MTGRKGDVWDHALGGVRVLREQCSTCIYRPGNAMHLTPGRVREMTDLARASDGYVICHQTIGGAEYPANIGTRGEALCRGFYDLPKPTAFIQIMGRLGAFREVDPPGEAGHG